MTVLFSRPLRSTLAAALLAAAALSAQAAPLRPLPADWDFTLPSLDGERFVTASKEPGPLLINFWGVDCAPCLAELPLLQELAEGTSGWRVLLVATDPPADALRMLQRLHVTLPGARGGQGARALMRDAGNTHGALPFSVLMRDGRACAHHLGVVNEWTLPKLLAQCPPANAPADAPGQP